MHWCGVTASFNIPCSSGAAPQAAEDLCAHMNAHGLQAQLPHHGMLQGLQGNLSSAPRAFLLFSTDFGVCRGVSLANTHSSFSACCCAVLFPLLTCIMPESLPVSLMALASGGSVLKPPRIGSAGCDGSF